MSNELLKQILEKKIESGHMSLATIQGGAIIEQADHELQLILQNIADPNTKLSKRMLTIKIGIKPINDDRAALDYDFDVTSTLAGAEKSVGRARIGIDPNGKGLFAEDIDRKQQLEIPFESNVKPLQR